MEALKSEFSKRNEYISELEEENLNLKSIYPLLIFMISIVKIRKKKWTRYCTKGIFMKI